MKKTNKSMRLLSILLTLLMVFSMLPLSVVSAESAQQTPNATVTELAPMTLTAAEHNYMVWPSGDSTIDRPLDVVVNFKANDTLEECIAGGYANWKTDFYLTVDGLKNDSIIADGCYLAGNYGSYGWIVIPTDGLEIEEGVTYPVVSGYDANLTYKDICGSVKDFTAAIHIPNAVLKANPDFKISLNLKMTNPEDENDVLTVGEPIVCTADELLLPNATVTELEPMTLTAAEHDYMVWPSGDDTIDRPLDVVVNFKANDTLEECLAGDYTYWKTDFYLTFDGLTNDSIIADDCYLAGNYGSFGWVVIPTDGLEIEEGVEYPVVKVYDANITYKQICETVKNFTAAIHVSDEILEANPDFKVSLSLKMTNPEDPTDVLVIDEPIVYTADELLGIPNATVTELEPMTLTAAEHNYMVWPSGDSTIDRPLDVVVNFKANDTLEECLAGDYAYWKTDFYLTFDGLKNDSIIADDCYLAGNYGSFGWIVIPTDGLEIEEGVEYPVVKAYDANITYKQICESVKNFTAAIHVSDEILEANPDFKVTLSLKMTNPEDPTDVLVIDEPIVCTIDDLAPIAENVNTGKTYADLNKALAEAAGKNETVKLMEDVNLGAAMNVTVQAGTVLDLNGKTISGDKLLTFISFGDVIDSTEGEGGVEISKTAAYTILSTTNTYLPIYDSAAGCYRFFKFEVINKGVKAVANDSDRIKYGYVLKFSSKTAYELLANDAANAGLELKAKLTVDKGDGNASVFDYTCTSGVLSTYANTVLNNYDIFTANYNTVITFAVSGIERLTDGSTVSTVPTLSAPATTVAKSGDSATFTK